jgi:Mn-dependent DtxR family transcriptional regulator
MMMEKSSWKLYSEGIVTHSGAHYLMAVHKLQKELGYARGADVARMLEVSPPSVALALERLRARRHLKEDRNKFYSLTDAGMRTVENILAHRRILQRFFEDVLGIDPETSEADACRIEHLISDATSRKLIQCLNLIAFDPAFRRMSERLHELGDSPNCSFPDGCGMCESKCILQPS